MCAVAHHSFGLSGIGLHRDTGYLKCDVFRFSCTCLIPDCVTLMAFSMDSTILTGTFNKYLYVVLSSGIWETLSVCLVHLAMALEQSETCLNFVP
jgi:hypothetical protein